jgi:hypothetical protein
MMVYPSIHSLQSVTPYPDHAVCIIATPYLVGVNNGESLFAVDCYKADKWKQLILYGWQSVALKANPFVIERIDDDLVMFGAKITELTCSCYFAGQANPDKVIDWFQCPVEVVATIERVYLEGNRAPSYLNTLYPRYPLL